MFFFVLCPFADIVAPANENDLFLAMTCLTKQAIVNGSSLANHRTPLLAVCMYCLSTLIHNRGYHKICSMLGVE